MKFTIKASFFAALFFFAGSLGFLSAEDILMAPFAPRSATILAQGGSFTAVARGYEALFTNPAAFACSRGSLTLMINPWVYGNPRDLLISAGALEPPADYTGPTTTFDDTTGLTDYLAYASKGGFGGGSSFGIGWVGRGLGLGIVSSTDLFAAGSPFPGGVKGYFQSDFALVGGLGFTLIDSKLMRLTVGADLRPTIRFYSPLTANTILDMIAGSNSSGTDNPLNNSIMYSGSALAIDAGLQLALFENLFFGLSVRDLFNTRYDMSQYPLGDWLDELQSSGIPSDGASVSDIYQVPMNISAGIGYHINMGALSWLFDPTVHLELADPLGVIRDNRSPWALLHMGMETKVLRFISLRAGLNQGYLTAGAGVKLLFIDLNVAAFTRELGKYAGDQASSGFALEAALRF
ncbi:hypothetical protein [Gracilinema caldarium]|uniref:hypothetical protein n=1 Tax=Gracilinema caldarium TaxID=215591 RepID=UPI0026EF63C1|nr:hypothetical protein [Gracilinema caldarium]